MSLGIPERQENLDGATTDEAKIQKVWAMIGLSEGIRASWWLGKVGRMCRPILVMAASQENCNAVLE